MRLQRMRGGALTNVVALPLTGDPPDAALVARARTGDARAQELLFRRHLKRIIALAYRLAPEEDPEDIAQETFVRALRRLDQLERPEAFAGWVNAIAVSLVRMRLRKRRWLKRLGLLNDEPLDPDALVSADAPESIRAEVRALYYAIGRLPEEERVALLLQRVEGLELSEIGERMGLSVATVKRRVAAAERALAEVRGDE